MTRTTSILHLFATCVLGIACACLALKNMALNRKLAAQSRPHISETNRLRRPLHNPSRPVTAAVQAVAAKTNDEKFARGEMGREMSPAMMTAATDKRIASVLQAKHEERQRRLEELRNMSPKEKAAHKEKFVSRMRERAEKRLKEFVDRTGLNAAQTEEFSSTVAALDATLQERAQTWADKIRSSGTFYQDARMEFVSDMSQILSAGYAEMDATLPATWRDDDGNINLMQIVGDAAFAPVVEALTETGQEDGLQTIGMLMGGPGGGEAGEGVPPEGGQGVEGEGPIGQEEPGQMSGPGMGRPGPGGR